ncbi:hypothetical protein Lser_V15G16445 [Lactuca serriola]
MEILFKVQKDIKKAYTMCYQKSVLNYNNFQLCTVAFYNKITEVQTEFQVSFNLNDHSIECSCGKFTIIGLLCCHSLRVLINNNVYKIPDMYIVPRWRKDIISVEKHSLGQPWEFRRTKTAKLIEEACRAAESFREHIFERVTKNLKVAQVFTTLVEEMKAIGLVYADDSQCTDVMVPMAHKDKNPVLLFMGGGMGD